MKKFIYSSLILGAAFALASCSADDPAVANGDGTVNVTLTLPSISTRALGDTLKCNELVYTVFNANGKPIYENVTTAAFGEGVNKATVTIQLVPNETYNVAFYAHNNTSQFSSFDNGVISVDYTKINPNNEIDDAFYYYGEITPTANQEVSATLYRAFAQLNFGSTDIDNAAVIDAFSGENTALTYTLNINDGIFTTFDMTAENAEPTGAGAITDLSGKIPAKNELFSVPDVSGVCSVYLLTTIGAKDNTDDNSLLEGSFDTFNNGVALRDRINLANVPVKMNYRTNVYGQLLSSNIPVTVTIDKIFNEPAYDVKVVTPETAEDLAKAITSPDATVIKIPTDFNAATLAPEDLVMTAPKQIDIADDATLYLPTNGTIVTTNDLTISGGTLKNIPPTEIPTTRTNEADLENKEDAIPTDDGSVILIYMQGGNLTIEDATLINAVDYRKHGATNNTAVIQYENECHITIKNSKLYSGEFTVCGMRRGNGTENSTVVIDDSYLESFSSSSDGTGKWAYATRFTGTATINNCTVVGIQGALSNTYVNTPEGIALSEVTVNGGLYYTHKEPGKTPFYAVYSTGGTFILNSGYFYGAETHSTLAQGTSCVVAGDNDTDQPVGNIVINGGYYSGIAYNHTTGKIYYTPENYKVVNKEYDGMTFKYEFVK